MEMLKPQNSEKLVADIAQITGLNVKKVKIRKVDYKNRMADLDIFY
jgi:hypothetical protein